jgi:hypothetical protein
VDNLCKIAQGLGITLSELCEGVDETESVRNRRILMEELLHKKEQKKAH